MLIGYARVSTEDQDLTLQRVALRQAVFQAVGVALPPNIRDASPLRSAA